jgi:hypothetical protein
MPRQTPSEEVQVLRFFENASYDKAETMLHIICDKMRDTLEARLRKMCRSLQAHNTVHWL